MLTGDLPLYKMPGKKKFRIELEDAEGSKYNLSLEGNISKDKILKIVEFMDLLNIENDASNSSGDSSTRSGSNRLSSEVDGDFRRTVPASVGDRISAIVDAKFPYGSFTSSDILELFEDTYNEPIKLSIISTYLSRYTERGRLVRSRQGKEWIYKTANSGSNISITTGSQVHEQRTSAAHPSSTSYGRLQ